MKNKVIVLVGGLLLVSALLPASTASIGEASEETTWAESDIVPDRLSVQTAERADTIRADRADATEMAVDLAKLAGDHHAQALGLDLAPTAGTDAAQPSEAMARVLQAQDHPVTQSVEDDLADLDELPVSVQAALVDVADAYLAMNEATDANLDAVDAETLERAEVVAREPMAHRSTSLQAGDLLPNAGGILAAQASFLDAAAELDRAVDGPQFATANSHSDVTVAPVLSIDLTKSDDTYTQDFALVVDVGGDDVYHNNAGGSCLAAPAPAAALVDIGGDEQYGDADNPRSCGANGGGSGGTGFLYDSGGDDVFTAGDTGTNGGGGIAGVGTLVNVWGNDSYSAGEIGANGGTSAGVGVLVDVHGQDSYDADGVGTNGGGILGSGFLADAHVSAEPTDEYLAGSNAANGGASLGASGFLLDTAGDETYLAGDGSTNGGAAAYASGSLIDLSGDDNYTAGSASVNGGGGGVLFPGSGLLLDGGGTDTYTEDGSTTTDETVVLKGIAGAQVDLLPQVSAP